MVNIRISIYFFIFLKQMKPMEFPCFLGGKKMKWNFIAKEK